MHFSLPSHLAAALASTAWSYGITTIPAPRAVGAACMWQWRYQPHKGGQHIACQGLPEATATNSAYNAAECNLWLCKGLQLADNKANVQKFAAGGPGYADLDSNSACGNGERERSGYENEPGSWEPLD